MAGIWGDVTPAQPGARAGAEIRFFQADDTALRSALFNAPHETSGRLDYQVPIPMPDGTLALFSVQESPIMAPELAAKSPGTRTFKVFGVDDKQSMGRIDITPLGFHGMIETPGGRIFIDPEDFRLQDHVYRTRFGASEPRAGFSCGVDGLSTTTASSFTGLKTANRISGSLMQYDLAVAVTLEYHQFFGDIVGNTTGAIATTINRVNFVYERDHGIRLNLVANNDEIYETTESGLLDNQDDIQLLTQVNGWIDGRLTGGDAAYDIGHMFSQPSLLNSGGRAYIGAVCDNSIKAGGVSGMPNPSGDSFDIDLVAHEIGHQFDAEHSFNGTTFNCVNRNASTAFEPGSGSSIMAYSGICANENLQISSDISFHAGSIAQVETFTAGAGNCFTQIPTTIPGNVDPDVAALTDVTIPADTAFLLESTASDIDLDTLAFRWDQMDTGCPTDTASFGTDNGSNPLFRSHAPRAEPWRNFPALGTQLQSRFDKADVLPCQNRVLDFRVTATDRRSGQDFEDMRVTVNASAGPFEITNVDTPIVAGTAFAVTWDVAGTNLAPISCANVDIDLIDFSADYGTYSVYSLGTRANTGSTLVTVNPANSQHANARIRVKCSNNVFYDLSEVDLTVTAVGAPVVAGDSDFTTRTYANIATTGFAAPACGAVVDCSPPPPASGSSSGHKDATSFDYVWLLLLTGLAAFRRFGRSQG
ncbi:MAG: hypothetical protein GY802_28990 [Gammaproteobacteria bacterium]|nr:hypothetical protein [Gammaproteobacteria bacterium]